MGVTHKGPIQDQLKIYPTSFLTYSGPERAHFSTHLVGQCEPMWAPTSKPNWGLFEFHLGSPCRPKPGPEWAPISLAQVGPAQRGMTNPNGPQLGSPIGPHLAAQLVPIWGPVGIAGWAVSLESVVRYLYYTMERVWILFILSDVVN